MGRRTRLDQGVVLLVSLGVLLVLSVLAVSFVRLAGHERHASSNYVHKVRAKFAARSGLRMASGRLKSYFRTAVVDTSSATWMYGNSAATPLEQATLPSYLAGKTTVEGSTVGYSGLAFNPAKDKSWLPPAYDGKVGINYSLKVTDLNTRININDPNPNMIQMLNNLGIGIAFYDSVLDPVKSRGKTIISTRDSLFGGQFNSVEDLIQAGLTKAEVEVLSNYVTVHSWRDTSVIRPKSQTSGISEKYTFDFPRFSNGTIAGRSPINMNTAPTAVIYAVLRGIAARGFRYTSGSNSTERWTFSTASVSDSQAKSVTALIFARRQSDPIKSHYDLARVLLSSKYSTLASMIMANLNPNTRLTKFNQDLTFFNYGQGQTKTDMFDKSDLTNWTTEAVFISHGYFQIESLGRCIGKTGSVLARHKLAQIVKVFEVAKHTTQNDFETNKISHTQTLSFPENMADQGFDTTKASKLDGQIALNDDTRREKGTVWYADNETSFFGPDSHRWTMSDFGKSGTIRLNENRPLDGKQSPLTRTILGEDRSSSTRTSAFASNLHPDGQFFGLKIGSRMNLYGVYDPAKSKSNVLPANGTLEWWYKPDLRGRTMTTAAEGLFSWFLLGPKCPVPAVKFMKVDLFGAVLSSDWLNGGGGDGEVYINGSLSSTARRCTDMGPYPYSDPYFVLTTGPSHRSSLRGQTWNHVRFTWKDWVRWRVYVNGVLVSSADATFIPSTGYVYWNVDVALDFLEFGALYCKDPWGTMWDYRSSGTGDRLRTNSVALPGGVVPYRYRTTVGGSQFRSRFKWAASGLGMYEALSIRFASTPAFNSSSSAMSYIGMTTVVGKQKYVESFNTSKSGPTPSIPGLALGNSFDPLTGVMYNVRFHDGGQSPFTATPYFDHVTLFYVKGDTQVLRRWVVE